MSPSSAPIQKGGARVGSGVRCGWPTTQPSCMSHGCSPHRPTPGRPRAAGLVSLPQTPARRLQPALACAPAPATGSAGLSGCVLGGEPATTSSRSFSSETIIPGSPASPAHLWGRHWAGQVGGSQDTHRRGSRSGFLLERMVLRAVRTECRTLSLLNVHGGPFRARGAPPCRLCRRSPPAALGQSRRDGGVSRSDRQEVSQETPRAPRCQGE